MNDYVSDIAFTPSVKAEQEKRGSRAGYQNAVEKRDWRDSVTDDLKAFIAERDSFYLATTSNEGQPYIQHRGGPKGFLRVLDERTLGIADYSGNRQYITVGNLAENDRAYIFLMDYANRRRVKFGAGPGLSRTTRRFSPISCQTVTVPGQNARSCFQSRRGTSIAPSTSFSGSAKRR